MSVGPFEKRSIVHPPRSPIDSFFGHYSKDVLHAPLSRIAKLSKHSVLDVKVTERCVPVYEIETRLGKITYYVVPSMVKEKPRVDIDFNKGG